MHSHSHMIIPQGPCTIGPELASFQVAPAASKGASPVRRICIEQAHTEQHRRGANQLLHQRYSWRGYRAVSLPPAARAGWAGQAALLADRTGQRNHGDHDDHADHLPLTASRDDAVIGTLTVGFDGPRGLNCEASFSGEVQALRAAGQRLCEFTKLAVDAEDGSGQVLAALFHVAFLAAHQRHRVDTVLLEVNPRHVRYYQRMLGASVVGAERAKASVQAPAVLLSISASHIRRQIDAAPWPLRPAQQAQRPPRSLYTQAFNRAEEGAILARLALAA